MAIKVWSLFEKFKLSELNNNFAELANRTVNGFSWGTNQNVEITASPKQYTIPALLDLNTIITTGFYNANIGNTCANKPSGVGSFGLLVYKSMDTGITQDLIEGNTTPHRRWSRQYNGSTWSSWIEIYTTRLDGSETPTASNLGTITTHTAIRKGNICRYVLRASSTSWVANTTYTICTLTANYRPSVVFEKEIFLRLGVQAVININTSGIVSITPKSNIDTLSFHLDEIYTI